MRPEAMNFDAALELTDGLDGPGFEIGDRAPIAPDFPIPEYRRRYQRLAALMEQHEFEALILTQEEAVRYLSGYNSVVWAVGRWLPTVLVATRDPRDAVLFGSVFDGGCAAGTAWTQTAGYTEMEALPALVAQHLADLGVAPGAVGVEYGPGSIMNVPQFIAADLLRLARDPGPSGPGPRDASPLVHALRMIKSPAEIDRVRRAVASAAAGYQAALDAAKPGMTEKELVSIIATTMYSTGSTAGTRPVFVNSVSGRERYPLVDTPASDRRIAAGDVVFIDGGAASDGYVSDILRLIGVGPLRAEDRRYAEVAAAATAAMVGAVRPGVRVSDLLRAAAADVAAAGVTDPVGVVAGHGIGLELWERPLIKKHTDPDEDVSLRPGMVLCLEPILAPPHPGGGLAGIFVFEQQVLVTSTGCDVLSAALPAHLWEI
jgi:Xaa-Pro aminopeptidase